MVETVYSYNIFWILVFGTITIISVSGLAILMFLKTKNKDNTLFNNIFNRHSDEHEDTTTKFHSLTDNVIKVNFTNAHEKELHRLEIMVKELNDKLDLLIQRVIILEKNRQQ